MPELADVVVIGGGITGVILAYALARRAVRVTLLESGELAREATGNGFAWLNATSKWEDESYHRLNARGMAYWAAFAAEWGDAEALGLRRGGALFWAADAATEGQARLRERAARLQAWNYPVTLLSGGEIGALEPLLKEDDLKGALGLFAPSDGWVETRRAVRAVAARARELGAEIREHSPAQAFTRDIGGRIATVRTEAGVISTRQVVLTAGLAIPALIARIMGYPEAAQGFPLRRVPGLLVETAAGTAQGVLGRVLYPPDNGGLHLRPTPEGGVLVGADDVDENLPFDIRDAPADTAARLLERAGCFLPPLRSLAEKPETWSARICARPMPLDGLPLVGALPGAEGVSVLATHSGVTLGPLLAQLLAEELITGRVPQKLTPYRIARFHHG